MQYDYDYKILKENKGKKKHIAAKQGTEQENEKETEGKQAKIKRKTTKTIIKCVIVLGICGK